MKKPGWIRIALVAVVWACWWWEWTYWRNGDLNLALMVVFYVVAFSGKSPRWPFWRVIVFAVFLWGTGWLFSGIGNISLGLVLQMAVLIAAFFLFQRWGLPDGRGRFFRPKAFREGGDVVFSWERGVLQRVPVAGIASYGFDAVWYLKLTMKDGGTSRTEIRSLSMKPEIHSVMGEAGIPYAET